MAKESFLRGALTLALASALSRVIGIVYLVILPRIIQEEGMGLFQLVRPIHYFAAVVAISGMPVAISKLVAEQAAEGSRQGVRQVFYLGFLCMAVTGLVTAAVLMVGAKFLAEHVARDSAVYPMIVILGPACFFLALSAAVRGYFQGLQYMVPSAISQVVDQVVRVAATVLMAYWLLPYGIPYAVAGAALGSLVGELAGWLVLVGFYLVKGSELLAALPSRRTVQVSSASQVLQRLWQLAVPAVVATILWPVMQMADTVLIPSRMQSAGFTPEQIRAGVGLLGMAMPVAQFPNIITVALSTSLIPAITEAWTLGSRRLVAYRSEEAIRFAFLFGIPAAVGLAVLAEPICAMLFGYPEAAPHLAVLASGAVTLGFIQATTGILQGLGMMLLPVRNLLVGVLVKFVLNYVFVGDPAIGAVGASYSTAISWAVVAVLNLYGVFSRVGFVLKLWDSVIKPLAATACLAAWTYYLQDTLAMLVGGTLSTIVAVTSGFALYFLLLMIWGSITQKDVALIPGSAGPALAGTLQAWGFLRK
ncbi:MAG: putative polysaccharide biosynthesis protein [Limnochordia bacterium]|jgi:stage V sporulation protein B